MKLNKITTLCILFISAISFAQNTDLDREYFSVSFVKLPSDPILDDSKRTYTANNSSIRISGFSKVNSDGVLDINYSFSGTEIGEVDILKTVHERKDDDGNVISRSYSYHAEVGFRSHAMITITDTRTATSSQQEYYGKDIFKSRSYNSYEEAKDYYYNNRSVLRNRYKSKHQVRIWNEIRMYLNQTYGYVPHNATNEYLWILGSKKHPEFKKHHAAYEIIKNAFTKMKYDLPLENIIAEVKPAIDIFETIANEYTGDKRKMRKLRYASYFNLSKIYYFLDMPAKANDFAKKIIDNDYDKSDGKNLNMMSNNLLSKFDVNQIKTRHFEILTEDLGDIVMKVEKEEDWDQQMEEVSDMELNKAYLITAKNDTLMVDIKSKDIPKIGYEVKTVVYDAQRSPVGTRVEKANQCREILFVGGDHYKNIDFKEASVNNSQSESLSVNDLGHKLSKVLFESETVCLYLFNTNETVLLLPGDDIGKSTLSKSFAFSFNDKLKEIARGASAIEEKIENTSYKNTPGDLLLFCKELSKFKKSN